MYSSLAKGIIPTPSCSTRTQKIDAICFHHFAGTSWTGKRCAESFADPNRKASANYCIGRTGLDDIWASADETTQRSWCSSTGNVANGDQRCVTIELANDTGAPNWHVSDATVEAAIQLAVDICKRNGIPKLNWSNDPNIRKTQANTVYLHKDWDSTSCPGEYLSHLIPEYMIPEINKRLSNGSNSPVEPPKPAEPVNTKTHYYRVVTGSFTNKDNAVARAKEIKDKTGYDSFITEVDI